MRKIGGFICFLDEYRNKEITRIRIDNSGNEMIKKTPQGWVLYSRDGTRKLGGPYRTREEAVNRERQVQFFKRARR